MEPPGSKSLFDDIFRLQNTAPDDDIDPEDPEDGAKARLVDTELEEAENLGPSSLRKKMAIISDDPKYKGRKTSRKDLYSDGEENEEPSMEDSGSDMAESEEALDFGDIDDDDDDDDDVEDGREEESSDGEESEIGDEDANENEAEDEVKILPESKSDDQEKGKAVILQTAIWDDLIKGRILLQKIVATCNRLPQSDIWPDFVSDPSFKQEAKNVHSSVRKVVSALLDLQSALATQGGTRDREENMGEESDEDIPSESDADKEDDGFSPAKTTSEMNGKHGKRDPGVEDSHGDDEGMENDEDETLTGHRVGSSTDLSERSSLRSRKRKLSGEFIEETLAERHADFQKYRNDTLSKWDEKTRLAYGKIKSKNFAAFEMSVLKQIEQVLVNRERLIRRIHQKRSDYRILGKPHEEDEEAGDRVEVEDDDDDVEIKLKQSRSEVTVEPEIIDDSDFYHVCLRDLIEMKQNEETDPVTANKQWLEIQRLRNKQKQKVDTKASKGRKIRYNVKEKLKNYMTPYDKSLWSEEQKDDLFKAMFGGKTSQDLPGNQVASKKQYNESSIILGL